MTKPFVMMFAGPNGSGKTTLRKRLEQRVDIGFHINPDEIALTLIGVSEPARTRSAQAIANDRRAQYLKEKQSFSFETVMSHPSKVDFMREAKRQGYHTIVHFVGLQDPSMNVQRVSNRVQMGGHDVPEHKIRERYVRTMGMLKELPYCCNELIIWDNSGIAHPHSRICSLIGDRVKGAGWEYSQQGLSTILHLATRRPIHTRTKEQVLIDYTGNTQHNDKQYYTPAWVLQYFYAPWLGLNPDHFALNA